MFCNFIEYSETQVFYDILDYYEIMEYFRVFENLPIFISIVLEVWKILSQISEHRIIYLSLENLSWKQSDLFMNF